SITSAFAGAAPPMREIRPFSTTINWLGAAVPVSGSINRPARIAMGWAARLSAENINAHTVGQAIAFRGLSARGHPYPPTPPDRPQKAMACPTELSLLRMNRHRQIVVPGVGESQGHAPFAIETHDRGAVETGHHPTRGQRHIIQRAPQRSRPHQLAVADEVSLLIRVALHAANAHTLAFADRLRQLALHDDRIVLRRRRVVAELVHLLAADIGRLQLLAGIEVVHLRIFVHRAAFAHEAVAVLLPHTRDPEIVRHLQLVPLWID